MDVYKGYTIECVGNPGCVGKTWYAVNKHDIIVIWSLSRNPEQVRSKIDARGKK